MSTFYVYQDGAQFYLRKDGESGVTRMDYPGKVRDFDLAAAEAARVWFEALCAQYNHAIVWED